MSDFINSMAAGFRRKMEGEIELWPTLVDVAGDDWWPAIRRLPELFTALLSLYNDPHLPAAERRIARRVLKYLMSPLDLVPELIYGLSGFREDIYLAALAGDHWRRRLGDDLLAAHGLNDELLSTAAIIKLGDEDLAPEVREHLALLLDADYVAGDCDDDDPHTGNETYGHGPGSRTIVFAGPGTGKTRHIEDELCRLLLEERVPPEQVVVTTFTNKAADELRVRVRRRICQEYSLPNPDDLVQRLVISTIHSFCYGLISEFHHHLLFLKGTFSPIDDAQRMLFLFRRGIGELQLKPVYDEWKKEKKFSKDLFHFYAEVGEIFDFVSEEVISGQDPALRHRYLQVIHGTATSVLERIVALYPRYWKSIQGAGCLDNSMVLAYSEALLDDPHVLAKVRRKWRYLLVDEYQDTNPIQDRIFAKIAGDGGHLFAVADDDQSIYAFRGADVRNATEFPERHPGARERFLRKHHRSTRALLEAGQQLISRNRVRRDKQLHTDNPEGEPPWLLEAPEEQLPEQVAAVLAELKESGWLRTWNDAALLFRAMNRRVVAYREALARRGIPTLVVGERHLSRKPLFKSLLAVLKLIKGEPSQITPRKRNFRILFELMGWRDREKMVAEVGKWHGNIRSDKYGSLLDLFYSIIADCGALEHPELLPELGALSSIIAAAEEELRSPDLLKRLGFLLQFLDAAGDCLECAGDAPGEAVQLMTVHKAKGLQFPVVVIADLNEGSFPADFGPSSWDLFRSQLGCEKPLPDPIEEERRVLYVGLTRARNLAVLASARGKQSRFLDEFDSIAVRPGRGCESLDPIVWPPAPVPPLHAPHGHLFSYNFCPRRYLLENRYGFAGRVIAPLRAGVSLHRALEILHRLLLDGETVTEERRLRILQKAWLAPSAKKAAEREFKELFSVFNDYARQLADNGRTRILATERPFYVAERDGVLTGKMDLVREREGRLEIVEFKYHRNPQLHDYARQQLDHYRLSMPAEEPALVVHYLKERREEAFSPRPAEQTRRQLADVFGRIRRGEFPARPAKTRCNICPVRFACAERK